MKRSLFWLVSILLLSCLTTKQATAFSFFEFSQNQCVSLDKADWVFYYGHTYDEVLNEPVLKGEVAKVPGNWADMGYPRFGYGTYVLRFAHDLSNEELLTLKLLNVGTAYDLYVNGKKLRSVGSFSKTETGAVPNFIPVLANFEVNRDTVEIAIQVSNFHYRNGGLWFSPIIGKHNVMDALNNKEMLSDAFLCGALFVLFCYFISFYYAKTEDKTALFFAFTCLFAALRIAATGELLMRHLSSSLPWEFIVKSEFVSLVFMLLFGVLYVNNLFPKDTNKRVLRMIVYIQIGMALVFFLGPIRYTSFIIPYYLYFCAFLLLYLLNLVIKVNYVRRPFAIWVGVAFVVVFIAGINDILYSQALIKSLYLMPAGIIFFALIQAYVLTKLFSEAFREVENLSNKLKNINQNQKEIIQERTSLLNMQAQELQRSNQIKDKVFSIISHDLRAPIKSLSTVLAWVADDDLTFEELKKSLGSISKNVDTLNLTLENLLQWSRSQLNGVKSEAELIDIRKPVQEIMELYKIQLAEKSIQFKFNSQERLPVYIDKHHLNLLLRNLVSNAIKFTKPGGVIEITAKSISGNKTLVCVKDDGVGMSKEAIEKVFSPLEHYTTYGTGNEKGTGLGLLLCKEYVDLNQGEIWIESEEGQGTGVYFSLPDNGN